jgi:PAS domain S-box-containing protein
LRDDDDALRQGVEQFRSAFTFAAIGMALVAPDGRFLQVNDSLCELVGYTSDELISRTFQDITHPDDLEADLEYVRQMLDGEIRAYQLEKRYVHKDGHIVWVLLSVSLVRAPDGTPVHFISQIQDITERKRTQEAIARSEARLAEAQQIARIGSWEWNVEANVVTWSDELYRIFGVERGAEELTYERYLEHLTAEDREAVALAVARSVETGAPFVVEHKVVLPDGTTRWVQGRGAVTQEEGRTVSMRGTAQDITERKAVEDQLAAAELRYRTLIEQLPLVTYIRPLDWAAANLYVSPQVEDMLGYSADAWRTNPDLPSQIIHPDDRDAVVAAGGHVRRTGEPTRQEYRYIAPDGDVVWVQDETYVVRDERGKPQSVQGYLIDITERKRAEEERDRLRDELHHAQRLDALGRLAGGVAHDFNNVLTAIRGYGELLYDDLEESSPSREAARQIVRAAEQASALPRQLLAFGRKQVLEPRLVDLDEIVGNSTELLRRVVRESVEIVAVRSSEPVHVRADPGQIEQVLLNLAVNARDAMPNGGTITIETRVAVVSDEVARERGVASGRFAVLSVTDTGHGMDAQTKSRAFEPFFTTKRPGEGSGLGLASVYGTVVQSGGLVEVQSEPGEGSRFEVYLPHVDAPAGRPDLHADLATSSAPVTVLLVEDEDAVRESAAMRLERAGYRVLTASSGTEALDTWCRRDDIGVVLTDIMMPGMGGRELADRILHLAPETPIVLMSGYSDEPPMVEVNGAQPRFLQKPFSANDLLRTVHQAVARVPVGEAASGASATCVIADDHPAVLDSVSRFLEQRGFEVVARASDGDQALAEIQDRRPAVVLLDVNMKPLGGIDVAVRAAAISPASRVVMYTAYADARVLERALAAGARGFVLKQSPLAELERALHVVVGGQTYVDPALAGAVTEAGARNSSVLTRRECDVLTLLAEGKTNDKVAVVLGISAETVQTHVRNAMGKLDADNRTQAVATAIRQSLIG